MSDSPNVPTRQPPRFVPTLTEVVLPPQVAAAPTSPELPEAWSVDDEAPLAHVASTPAPVEETAMGSSGEDLQEQLTIRVLERLRPRLAGLLDETIAQVVRSRLDGLEQDIRRAVDEAVHQAVLRAVADEQASRAS